MFADPMLAMLVFILLPLVAGLICLCFSRSNVHTRIDNRLHTSSARLAKTEKKTLGVLSIANAYDPECNVIWENQIFALQRIGAHIAIPELLVLWERYPRLYPELYEGTTFSDWLAFLQSFDLVEADEDVVRLTANGRIFLNCLICNTSLSGGRRALH